MTTCTICHDRFPFYAPCARSHEDLCHWCAEHNMPTHLDEPAHPAPPEPLSLREASVRRVRWAVPVANVPGAHPPRDGAMVTAREALLAYMAAATPPTPRQAERLRRLTVRYLAQAEDR